MSPRSPNRKECHTLEQVYYEHPTSDDEATREGKFEAVLDVVCHGEQKSDVIPTSGCSRVLVAYAEGERSKLEPLVLAIMRNTDRTYWDTVEAHTGIKWGSE